MFQLERGRPISAGDSQTRMRPEPSNSQPTVTSSNMADRQCNGLANGSVNNHHNDNTPNSSPAANVGNGDNTGETANSIHGERTLAGGDHGIQVEDT